MEAYQDVGKTRYRFIKSAIYDYLRNGTTIIYNRINNEPFADNLAKQVAQFARAQTIVSGYLAFGSDSSYGNHWDTRDVFAVQLVGKKHWTLSAPNFDMPLYMQQAKDMPHIKPPQAIDMEVVLEAGDVLYIARLVAQSHADGLRNLSSGHRHLPTQRLQLYGMADEKSARNRQPAPKFPRLGSR